MAIKVIMSLSGGMDSATLLGTVLSQGYQPSCVGFFYGAKHNLYENAAAQAVAAHYSVPYRQLDLSSVMAGIKSNLMTDGGDVPEGHYEADSMSLTVVPARNLIFASLLTGIAWSEAASEVYLGIHAGDHLIYPDCRPVFYEAMKQAIWEGTDAKVNLKAPFLRIYKAAILKIGIGLKVPYQLTRTCYKAQAMACGKCGSCQERLESFRLNEMEDPIPYESREALPK